MRTPTPLEAWRVVSACLLTMSLHQLWLALACRALMLLAVLALTACARLPVARPGPESTAIQDMRHTTLAQITAASDPQPALHRSGFRLLPSGGHALEARLALVQQAQRSLDLQYYQVAHDSTGLQLLRALRDAGQRGVRVRLLVDDLYAAGQDALLAGLAAQANVEVRLFNPLPVREAGFGARVALSLHEFPRINRRMHNKLFVADNCIAISGGRNIADEYFGRSEPANFIDLDVLATGPVVQAQSEVFDRFWNSPQAWPVQQLLAGGFDAAAARAAFDQRVQPLPDAAEPTTRDELGRASVGSELKAGRLSLHFAASVQVLADAPAKADAAAPDTDGQVAAAHRTLLRDAHSEVLLASPYVVPGATDLEALTDVTQRQVQFSVITNSLSTTDEPLVHAGYARYRRAMLKMGVKLYELMPSLTGAAESRPGAPHEARSSLARLHAKLAVVDRRWLYIGSMNMDRRSALTNTEAGLIIEAPALCDEVRALLHKDRIPGSYRLRLQQEAEGNEERIEWLAGDEAAGVVHREEPQATLLQSLKLWLALRVVGERML